MLQNKLSAPHLRVNPVWGRLQSDVNVYKIIVRWYYLSITIYLFFNLFTQLNYHKHLKIFTDMSVLDLCHNYLSKSLLFLISYSKYFSFVCTTFYVLISYFSLIFRLFKHFLIHMCHNYLSKLLLLRLSLNTLLTAI